MAKKLSPTAKARARAGLPKKATSFSIFQVVTGVVSIMLTAVLVFHLAPLVASLIVAFGVVATTYLLQSTGRI